MSKLLDEAIAEVRKLTGPDQDAIDLLILELIADDRDWDQAFTRSHDQLARLAEKVREDIAADRVRSLGRCKR